MRAYASHQQVGRTNRKGNLLVPGLLPYYGNTVSIAEQDIPLDRSVEATQRIIAPPFRGGALVTFPVRRTQHSTGRVVLLRRTSASLRYTVNCPWLRTATATSRPLVRRVSSISRMSRRVATAPAYCSSSKSASSQWTIGAATTGTLQLGVLECVVCGTGIK